MTTDGTIEFYHTNPIKNYGISDFKRKKLTDGSIRYTFMQQTKPMPPYAWWYGKLIVLDENFQKINELSLIAPTADEGLIENHDSLLLTDNHYILTGYRQRKERINGRESSVVTLLLQEIKNNRVIFEWNSGDHPELIKESLTACNYKKDLDYVHFNSMIIDPSDNNLILSFRHTSAIYKIDRKTGEIIWRLGGKNDDFGLTPEQRFNFQHTASLTNDGYLMLYDNHTAEINTECAGNFSFLPRKTSRILKFKLDEKNKKILNWQEIPLSVYSEFMGNVFETEDKTYIVGYGSNKGKAAEGTSSGDSVFERAAVWIQGLFNKSKRHDTARTEGFDADSSGVALGAEKFVTDNFKIGLGYAYANTDIDGFMRSTDVDTHSAILYGEYKPSQWYVNGIATYGWSDYSEGKNVAGIGVDADYDVETFGLQAMTGYELQSESFVFVPETGLRYVHISQDAYKDSADQRVSANDSDLLTGVLGARINRSWEFENGISLKPEARFALTYDLVNDAGGSVVTLANGSAYAVDGEALDRFGMELGVGVTAEVDDNIEVSLGYEGKFREKYHDHTGLLNAKYKF